MTTIRPLIVKNKQLKNGKHTVRLSVMHNGTTRYVPTSIVIDNEDEIFDGMIVNRADSRYLNTMLQKEVNKLTERIESVKYADSLTCSQLLSVLKDSNTGQKHRTFDDVAEEYISTISEDRVKTRKLYSLAARNFISFAGKGSLLEQITPLAVNSYLNSLKKSTLSQTTINIYITLFRVILNYSKKMKYVEYDVDPFAIAKVPSARKRETFITVEQLRMIRDAHLPKYNLNVVRDMFMLTYYLAGMNLIDLLSYDFRKKDEICYIRTKTRNTKDGDSYIRFTIPEEAKPIIAKYMNKRTGKIVFGKYTSYVSCYNVLTRKMKMLSEYAAIEHHFTLYSARKSFVQHGFDLGIPLSTLEYCIGQSMKSDRPIFNYLSIMQKHADKAIRMILDNLKNG